MKIKRVTLGMTALLLVLGVTRSYAQNIDIAFSGIRSARGQVIVKIYVDDKSFDDNKPVKKQ